MRPVLHITRNPDQPTREPFGHGHPDVAGNLHTERFWRTVDEVQAKYPHLPEWRCQEMAALRLGRMNPHDTNDREKENL